MNRRLLLVVVNPVTSQLLSVAGAFSISRWHSPGSQGSFYSYLELVPWELGLPWCHIPMSNPGEQLESFFSLPTCGYYYCESPSKRNSQAGPTLASGQYLSILNPPIQKITLVENLAPKHAYILPNKMGVHRKVISDPKDLDLCLQFIKTNREMDFLTFCPGVEVVTACYWAFPEFLKECGNKFSDNRLCIHPIAICCKRISPPLYLQAKYLFSKGLGQEVSLILEVF